MKTPRSPDDSDSDTGTAPLDAEEIDSGEIVDSVSSTSDSGRLRRRISASRPSEVGEGSPRKSGLFRRVSQALRIRGGSRRDYFRGLIKDRDILLREYGRRALECYGGVGLPEDFLRRLAGGESVSLAEEDLAEGDLELFRRCRQRLQQLDAEIEALRHELQLEDEIDEDDGCMLQTLSDDSVEERVYETLDGVGTEPLPEEEAAEDLAVDLDEEPSSARRAGRRRGRRRR